MQRTPPRLVTERLILRLAGSSDLPAILAYTRDNREHLGPWEPARDEAFYGDEAGAKRIAAAEAAFQDDREAKLVLFDRADDRRVRGTASLTAIARGPAQMCNLGYGLARDAQGQGLMHEALRAVIAYAFGDLGLHRIQASYQPHNTRSGQVLARLGFLVEGRAAAYIRIAGRWADHVLTSLTNPAWSERP